MNDFKDTLRCAKQGNADARYEAGLAYFNGDGVRKSHKKAAKWFKLAAAQGVTEAQYLLADCYCKGDGVFRNATKAVIGMTGRWNIIKGKRTAATSVRKRKRNVSE